MGDADKTMMTTVDLGAALEIAQAAGVPRLTDYFGAWAVEPQRFAGLVETVRGMDLAAHIREATGRAQFRSAKPVPGQDFDMTDDGVAVISVEGVLMKQVGSLEAGTSSVALRQQVRAAVAHNAVRAIVLRIDSPGGTVAGTDELGADIAEAAKTKPVTAYIEDLGASAAYWLASQAGRVVANRSALVGSIGVFTVIHDASAMAEEMGIKVHVVRAGAFKGMGAPGTEITGEQLAEVQRLIDASYEMFVGAVAAGRRMKGERVRELADGRVHPAAEALKLGLIDGIESFDAVLESAAAGRRGGARATKTDAADISAAAEEQSTTEEKSMSGETKEQTQAAESQQAAGPQPATAKELKEALPKADSDFLFSMIESGQTLAQAKALWAREETRREQAEEAAAKDRKVGVPALESGGKAGGGDGAEDAREAYEAAIRERQKATGCTRPKAAKHVNRTRPDLRQAFVEAHNAEHGRAIA